MLGLYRKRPDDLKVGVFKQIMSPRSSKQATLAWFTIRTSVLAESVTQTRNGWLN